MAHILPPGLDPAKTCSVLVAHPEAPVRAALVAALGAVAGLDVVGEAADGDEALDQAVRTRPDTVLLGTTSLCPEVVTAIARIRAAPGLPKVIVLAGAGPHDDLRDALRAGAAGVLDRDTTPECLLAAIPAVAAGHLVVAPGLADSVIGGPSGVPGTGSSAGPGPVVADHLLSARDVHDVLGRTLAAINRKSELAAQLLAGRPDRAGEELEGVCALARRSMAEVRALAGGYRLGDLAAELDGVRADLETMGTAVEVDGSPAALPRPVQEAFGWVAREAAANIIQHSTAATCSIEVRAGERTALLRIVNDGAGDGYSVLGTGLAGLAGRLRAVGGTLVHGPGPDRTFHVEATVPLERSNDLWRTDGDQGRRGRG